jgi:serine/threonine-protein kinase
LAGLENGPAVALSADGSQLVYVATERGAQQLYLRAMNSLEAKPLIGTDGASSPFFSPDGKWVGFFAGGKVKKISVSGGATLTLSNAVFGYGASWGSQGVIAFVSSNVSALQQVPDAGGASQPLTHLQKGENSNRWPEFLPGGKAVLFIAGTAAAGGWNNAQVSVLSLGTGERRNLIQDATQARYATSGHLIYTQGGNLMAVPFDAQRLQVTGAAIPVAEGVRQSGFNGDAQYSLSATGALVYVPGASTQRIRISFGSAAMGRSNPWLPRRTLTNTRGFPPTDTESL